jgi:hypothetical protein
MQPSAASVRVALYWLLGWVPLGWRWLSAGGKFTDQEPNNPHLLPNTIFLLSLLGPSCPCLTCLKKILLIKITGQWRLGEVAIDSLHLMQ